MPTKYLYVLPGALSATKKTFDETDGKASEVSEAQIDGQSGAAKMGGGDAPVTTASPPNNSPSPSRKGKFVRKKTGFIGLSDVDENSVEDFQCSKELKVIRT